MKRQLVINLGAIGAALVVAVPPMLVQRENERLRRQITALQADDRQQHARNAITDLRIGSVTDRLSDLDKQLGDLQARREANEFDTAKVAAIAKPSVVTIEAPPYAGTGFVIGHDSEGTLIITNHHVISDHTYSDRHLVTVRQGSKSWTGDVWSWNEKDDIALIIAKGANLPALLKSTKVA